MTDKNFCLSSYIAYRYIYDENMNFYDGMKHVNFTPPTQETRRHVRNAEEIDREIQEQFDRLYEKYDSIGILLSGGMDSAILASYLKPGSHAYTFTAQHTKVFNDDENRAIMYCKKFGLNHHLIDISFDDYKEYTPIVVKTKCAPVHSIEPQIYKAALAAKTDGVQMMIVGESADLIFGGMDQLISREWEFDAFKERYTFLDPNIVLSNPDNKVFQLFEKYRIEDNKIDYMTFMDEVFSIESSSSYLNAFNTAEMPYYDPYAILKMAEPLDLDRVRSGEPKYLVRDLFAMKYPEIPIPFKIPMPRPVDMIFKDWKGPQRKEFRNDIPMDKLTGNQKWQLWCAELFLNEYDK